VSRIEPINSEHVTCDSSVLRVINSLIMDHNQMLDDLSGDFKQVIEGLNDLAQKHNMLASHVKEIKDANTRTGLVGPGGRPINS